MIKKIILGLVFLMTLSSCQRTRDVIQLTQNQDIEIKTGDYSSNDAIDISSLLDGDGYQILNCFDNDLWIGHFSDGVYTIKEINRFTKQIDVLKSLTIEILVDSYYYKGKLYLLCAESADDGFEFYILDADTEAELVRVETDKIPLTVMFGNYLCFTTSGENGKTLNGYSLEDKEHFVIDEFKKDVVTSIGGSAMYFYAQVCDSTEEDAYCEINGYNLFTQEKETYSWQEGIDYISGNSTYLFTSEHAFDEPKVETSKVIDKDTWEYFVIPDSETTNDFIETAAFNNQKGFLILLYRSMYYLSDKELIKLVDIDRLTDFYIYEDNFVLADNGVAYFYENDEQKKARFDDYKSELPVKSAESQLHLIEETNAYIYYEESEPSETQRTQAYFWKYSKEDKTSECLGELSIVVFYDVKREGDTIIYSANDSEQEPVSILIE